MKVACYVESEADHFARSEDNYMVGSMKIRRRTGQALDSIGSLETQVYWLILFVFSLI